MQVDFYHLTRDPLAAALALIAGKTVASGERLLVVSADETQRRALSQALWSLSPESFLANGLDGEPHADRQPVLFSQSVEAANGARFVAIVDNVWRESAEPFARTFFFFEDDNRGAAREAWSALGQREGVARNYWKQDGGRWTKAA